MHWSHLHEFILKHRPDFLATAEGVAPIDIAEVERLLEIHLPPSYKDYLLAMGTQEIFSAFGGGNGSSCNFFSVTKYLKSRHYPFQKLFLISQEDHSKTDSCPSVFIDLEKSKGYDAFLVEYDPYNDFDESRVQAHPLSFLELLSRQIAIFFLELRSSILFDGELEALCADLESKGYTAVWPETRHIRLYCLREVFILVEDQEEPDQEFRKLLLHVSGANLDSIKGLTTHGL